MTVAEGGARLRELRSAKRLSQAELAQRSGVSQRSIRGLESGETRRPHPATLRALAAALDLSESRAAQFARSFIAPVVTDMADVLGVSPLVLQEQLPGLHEASHAANWTADVLHSHQIVGADGHFELSRVHRVIRSTIDGLTHVVRLMAYESAVDFLPAIVDLFGASVAQHWLLTDLGLAVYEFALPRPLMTGDTHAYGYAVDHSPPPEFRRGHAADTSYLEGSRGSVNTFVVEMQFEETVPSLITPFTVIGTGERQFIDPVRPDDTGTVRLQAHRTTPGQALGFTWQW
ncbi:helix-turn-helix domain-containing protein [Propionibacteriaceae bacterium Y1685]